MKNTVRRINLEGELGEKFGKIWYLNVKSPAEAIHAIDCQRRGFRKYFLDTGEKGVGYEVIIGDQAIEAKEPQRLAYPAPMRDDFTILPIPAGSKSKWVTFIIGAIMFYYGGGPEAIEMMVEAGATEGATLATIGEAGMAEMSMMGMMGGAMMASSVAMMLAPSLEGSAGNEEQSYLFDGAQNSVKQGTPVPLLYGRMIVGGAVISASIKSNQESGEARGYGRVPVVGTNTSSITGGSSRVGEQIGHPQRK